MVWYFHLPTTTGAGTDAGTTALTDTTCQPLPDGGSVAVALFYVGPVKNYIISKIESAWCELHDIYGGVCLVQDHVTGLLRVECKRSEVAVGPALCSSRKYSRNSER